MSLGRCREDCLKMVFLQRDAESANRGIYSHASQPISARHGAFHNKQRRRRMRRRERTHIGILGVHTCCGDHPSLLLILLQHKGVGVDVAMDDLEACLIGDPVAVSQGTRIVVSGHIMECSGRETSQESSGTGRASGLAGGGVACWKRVGNWPRLRPEPTHKSPDPGSLFVHPKHPYSLTVRQRSGN